MADKKKMSVAEILAAARKTDGGDAGGGTEGTEPANADTNSQEVVETTAEESAAPEAAAKPKPATSASGGRPSVAEMLAMARGEKAGGGEKKAAPKPAAKKAAAKPAAKKPAAAKKGSAEPRDTASILAAARKANKPGPMNKAEAAAKAKADPKVKEKPPIVVPPMPEKPAYAMPKPSEAKKAKGATVDENRRGFLWTGYAALAAFGGLWSLAALKFLFPNVRREPPSKFKVGFPMPIQLGRCKPNSRLSTAFGSPMRNTTANSRSMPSNLFVPIWAARPVGWTQSKSTNARAMVAVSTKTASTLRGLHRGRWSAVPSESQTMARSKSTKVAHSKRKWGIGKTQRATCPFRNAGPRQKSVKTTR